MSNAAIRAREIRSKIRQSKDESLFESKKNQIEQAKVYEMRHKRCLDS